MKPRCNTVHQGMRLTTWCFDSEWWVDAAKDCSLPLFLRRRFCSRWWSARLCLLVRGCDVSWECSERGPSLLVSRDMRANGAGHGEMGEGIVVLLKWRLRGGDRRGAGAFVCVAPHLSHMAVTSVRRSKGEDAAIGGTAFPLFSTRLVESCEWVMVPESGGRCTTLGPIVPWRTAARGG